MQSRQATSVTQLYPTYRQNSTVYMTSHYEVGKQAQLPNFGLEYVDDIEVRFAPILMAEIYFRDYGSILLTDWITEIRFQNSDYLEVRSLREADKQKEE